MKFKFNYYWFLLLIPLLFILWFFVSKHDNKPSWHLAYFGPRNGLKVNDTLYHFIPPFEFTNQYNEKVTEQTVKGKIYVTEFFFTTCQSICPIMNNYLEKVYQTYHDDPDFLILSHTVDPETDSVPALLDYARQHGVKDRKWLFLTGSKQDLYQVARKGYLLNAEAGDGGPDDFIHTQNFALIDKDRHIRGFYDGTDSVEIGRLIREIKILQQEYAYAAAHP